MAKYSDSGIRRHQTVEAFDQLAYSVQIPWDPGEEEVLCIHPNKHWQFVDFMLCIAQEENDLRYWLENTAYKITRYKVTRS